MARFVPTNPKREKAIAARLAAKIKSLADCGLWGLIEDQRKRDDVERLLRLSAEIAHSLRPIRWFLFSVGLAVYSLCYTYLPWRLAVAQTGFEFRFRDVFQSALIWIVMFFLPILPAFLSVVHRALVTPTLIQIWFAAGSAVAGVTLWALRSVSLTPEWKYRLAYASWLWILPWLCLWADIVVSWIVHVYWFRQQLRFAPEMIAVESLLEVGRELSSASYKWFDGHFRRRLLQPLEQAARATGAMIITGTGDGPTEEWAKERARTAANGIRQFKRWLITPKMDTKEHLTMSIVSVAGSIASSELDSLPSGDSWMHRDRAFIFHALRVILVATLPLVGVLVVRATNYARGHELGYAVIVAAGWAFLRVLFAIDPEATRLLAILRGVNAEITSGTRSRP